MLFWSRLSRRIDILTLLEADHGSASGNISVSSGLLGSVSLVGRRVLFLNIDGPDELPATAAGRSAQKWMVCNLRGRTLSPLASGQQSGCWRTGVSARLSGAAAYFPAASLSGFLNFRPRHREIDASDD